MHNPWVAPVFPIIRLWSFRFLSRICTVDTSHAGSQAPAYFTSGRYAALICGICYRAFRKQQKWRTTLKRDRSRCVGNTRRTIQQGKPVSWVSVISGVRVLQDS